MYRLSSIAVLVVVAFQVVAQSPHGDALKIDCASCHTSQGWLPVKDSLAFSHDGTDFPLTGIHKQTECRDCHTSLVFGDAPSQCINCHKDIHSMSVGNNCVRCHTSQSWIVDNIPELHEANGFVLAGMHGTVSCASCHKAENNLRFDRIGNDCLNCHRNDFQATTRPDHTKAGYSTNCLECHDPLATTWNSATTDHSFFPLTGGHDIADCAQCHKTKNYSDASPECVSCHLKDYSATINPNHSTAKFPTDCKQCHTTGQWAPSSFDHNTIYPLVGGHKPIANDCVQCHAAGYVNTPNTCVGCHQTDYNATTNPNHKTAQFTTDCKTCHTESAWVPSAFDHNTVYPLQGAHKTVAANCNLCHSAGYVNTPNTCVGCHQTDYNTAASPNHKAEQFPTDCKTCHSENAWAPSSFDHNTIYPLIGAHNTIASDCKKCHAAGYVNTPNTCVGCHQTDYNATTNPNHKTAQFTTDCKTCHTESAWVPSAFDHNTVYPLQGAHKTVAANCNLCHSAGYVNTPNTCVGCHQPDYDAAASPNHKAEQFPTDCKTCHSENAWAPSSFDHNTIYPLIGAHNTIASDCKKCHAAGYVNTPNTCVGCHQTDYNATTNPNHKTAQFTTDCKTCHTESAWVPSAFDHNTVYPLQGAHKTVAANCNLCHSAGYVNTPNTCVGCHQTDYNTAASPNHKAEQFPTDCKTCHSENAWAPSSFDHNTIYPLIGAHNTIASDCKKCHAAGYVNTPNTCVGCHQTDYNATTNPNHKTAQFTTDCKTCHTESAWVPSAFDHNTVYPLQGAHKTVAANCNLCHSAGYVNTPNTCVGCHQPDYDAAASPNHKAEQFPTDCKTCHSENAWAPSSFDHNTIYPLIGAHNTIASDCKKCHAAGYVNTPNTCVGCHQADYNATLNPNHQIAQFATDCKKCHTESAWIPSAFDHNTVYPLQGAHKSVAANCNLCHSAGYVNTPNTCVGCHQTDYNATTNPKHSTSGFGTDCKQCHTEGAWIPSTFDHDGMYFPIYSGRHKGAWQACTECHTTPNNFGTFSCIVCHEHNNKSSLDNKHQGIKNYSYTATSCFTCHPDGRK